MQSDYPRIPLELIDVRPDRQRRSVSVEDLLPSIRLRGVIQPIIVERSATSGERYDLIAGERRFQASRELRLADIPARLVGDLTAIEREIIELEENAKRLDLPWQDSCRAISRIHFLYCQSNPDWTQHETAAELGISQGVVSVNIRVAEELAAGNKAILTATGVNPAFNIIARKDNRALDDVMNDILESSNVRPTDTKLDGTVPQNGPNDPGLPPVHSQVSSPIFNRQESILTTSFLEFAPQYSGQKFNLLHCDFPYGINHQRSEQGRSEQWGGYADEADIYWKLCQCLCTNIDRLLTPSAHVIFWLSCDIERQYETLKFFSEHCVSLTFRTVPLYWTKTDGRGILPDPNRGPRQIVETAIIGSRGDRHIVRATNNAYWSPSSADKIHQSEKPEPMLRHFFQMFVDENTRMLDPTCGSASSLRAAESLGAETVLGLEINPDFADAARVALRKFRNLREITK